jgi:spore coat protein CotF
MSKITHNLPSEDMVFVNRQHLVNEVLETISHHRFWMIILWGMGGVGKTSLALHVSYQCLQRKYFDAIIWTTAKSYELGARGFKQTYERKQDRVVLTLNDLFNTILRVLGEHQSIRLETNKKQARVVELLSTNKILVIIDNLDMIPDQQAAEIVKFVRYSIPTQSSTAILTSRYEIANRGEYAFEITGLDIQASIELMRQSARQVGFDVIMNADTQILEAIHYATGGIPLAIKWVLGRMRRSKRSVYDVLDELVKNESDVLEYCFKQAYWNVSRDARLVLQAISPAEKPLDSSQLTNLTGLRDYQILDAVEDLLPMSLLEKDKLGRFKLHPLTKAFARLELAKNVDYEREVLRKYNSMTV